MLRGLYVPSDFDSNDMAPEITPEAKLAIIAASPVEVHPLSIEGRLYRDDFTVKLPFTDGSIFSAGLSGFPEVVLSDHINVGDKALYGHGIGSRLLRAALRYAVMHDPHACEFYAVWARLGLVNTVVSVVGEENVGVEKGMQKYGMGGDKPLEAMLEDFPPQAESGRSYQVGEITARFDRDLAMTWELPVEKLPEQQF